MTTQPNRSRVLLIAGLGVLALVAIGLVIALTGGSDDTTSATGGEVAFGPVTVEGAALPSFETTSGDSAAGLAIPLVEGTDPEGQPVSLDATGEPTLIVFLAHWCPHCQEEVPVLVDAIDAGDLAGVRVVGVLTATNADQPNYPPVAWLEREGWPGEILLDDERSSALAAFGPGGFPYMVVVDGDGAVVARSAGELPAKDIVALVDLAR